MKGLDRYQQDYNENGFISPVRIISFEEAKKHRDTLENTEKVLGNMHYQSKIHTILKSAYELATNKNILDMVEKVIGSNILLHNTTYIIKEPQSPTFVSWHQDLTYWGFSHDDQISVWLALSSADEISGAMYMIPGSHLEGKKNIRQLKTKTMYSSKASGYKNLMKVKKPYVLLKLEKLRFTMGGQFIHLCQIKVMIVE